MTRRLAIWGLGLLLALGAGFVAWRLAPVASDDVRLVLAAMPVVLWAFILLLTDDRRGNPGVAAPSGEPARDRGEGVEAEETQWRAALRAHRLSGSYRRYRLPLFVLLGSPGVGKSQLLERSGLDLDPPVEFAGALWWLGSEAIFVEISNEPAAVGHLSAILRRFRPLCPVNSVIVAVSPADLTLSDALERREIGEAMAASLAELEKRSRARLPVYVALTKIDLAPGFAEGFDALEPAERQQPWGFSFPASMREGASLADVLRNFRSGIAGLIDATRNRLFDSLAFVDDPLHGGRLFAFGPQLAAMDPIVEAVLRPILPSDVRRRKGAFLRGVYVTSSQQDGLSIDVLLPELAARYAMPRSGMLPDLEASDAEYGFFVTGMLRKAVIAEAGLVGKARMPWYRRPLFGTMILVACSAIALFGAAWLYTDYQEARSRIARFEAGLDRIGAQALVSDAPTIDALLAAAATAGRLERLDGRDVAAGLWRPFVRRDLEADAAAIHERALANSLLPHLEARLAADLVDLDASADAIAERLLAASPDLSESADARARWIETTAESAPNEAARNALLSEAPAALSAASFQIDAAYRDAAGRILAWKESQR